MQQIDLGDKIDEVGVSELLDIGGVGHVAPGLDVEMKVTPRGPFCTPVGWSVDAPSVLRGEDPVGPEHLW